MDYSELAKELLLHFSRLRGHGPHKNISDSMRGETFILNMLSLRGDNVQPSEISNRMGISAARITAALNSLEKKGFITRRIDPGNRRRILIELTEPGKEQAHRNFETLVERTGDMLGTLGEHDAKEFVRITGILANNLSDLNCPHGGK